MITSVKNKLFLFNKISQIGTMIQPGDVNMCQVFLFVFIFVLFTSGPSYMLSLNGSLFIIYKELINYLLTLTKPLVAVKPH